MNFSKEQLKVVGNTAARLGKAVVVEGTKAVVLKAAAQAITTSFDSGFDGVKKLTLDDVIGGKKDKSEKKSLFGKRKKDETQITVVETEVKKTANSEKE